MPDINQILNELFMLDPELKKNEDDVRKIVEKLLESNPETKFDREFASRLRKEILEKAQRIKSESPKKYFFSTFVLNKFAYAIGGATITLIAVLILIPKGTEKLSLEKALDIKSDQGIEKLSSRAFGQLSFEGTPTPNTMEAKGLGGGGGSKFAAPVAMEESAVTSDIAKMYVPEYINYEFSYIGDDINISENKMEVYKRIKDNINNQNLAKSVTGLDIDLLNLKKLKNTELDYININEDRKYGYSVNINFKENSLSLFPNWKEWPQLNCQDQACFKSNQLTSDDIPNDSKLIKIAKNFVKEYGIDTNTFQEPIVQNTWRDMNGQSEFTKSYIPEDIQVVFPLIINEQTVFDWGGNPFGLYVNVNIRHNKVSSVNNIVPQNYESSKYPIITNINKLIGLAEQGGIYAPYQYPDPTQTIEVKLDTPKISLIQHHKYDHDKNESDELYIPALIFPIVDISDDAYYRQKNIIIPLIKDIIDSPQVMPMREPGVGGIEPMIGTIESEEIDLPKDNKE